jgi:eukaryotic-like serine/threonine-protein kinase
LDSMTPIQQFKGPTLTARALDLSPDGRTIATIGVIESTRIWDAATGALIRELPGDAGVLFGAAFLSDRSLIACGGVVRAWDPTTGDSLWRNVLGGPMAGALACDRASNRIAVGTAKGQILILDGSSGREIVRLDGHQGQTLALAFAGQDRLISGGDDGIVKVWDVVAAREIHAMKGHWVSVLAVAASPDGTRVVSGSSDNTIRLWDVASGDEILALRHHTGGVQRVLFTPDGHRIISCGDDGRVHVWNGLPQP